MNHQNRTNSKVVPCSRREGLLWVGLKIVKPACANSERGACSDGFWQMRRRSTESQVGALPGLVLAEYGSIYSGLGGRSRGSLCRAIAVPLASLSRLEHKDMEQPIKSTTFTGCTGQ